MPYFLEPNRPGSILLYKTPNRFALRTDRDSFSPAQNALQKLAYAMHLTGRSQESNQRSGVVEKF